MGDGWTVERIRKHYSGIDDTGIRAYIAYGSEMSRERYIELPMPSLRGWRGVTGRPWASAAYQFSEFPHRPLEPT